MATYTEQQIKEQIAKATSDFAAHDNADYLKYYSSMSVTSDFRLVRTPKDAAKPGPLALDSKISLAPAYVNTYVDLFNTKYLKQTPSTYQVTEATKGTSNGISGIDPVKTAIQEIDLSKLNTAVPDATNVTKPVLVQNPITGQIQDIADSAKDVVTTTAQNFLMKYKKTIVWALIGLVGIWLVPKILRIFFK